MSKNTKNVALYTVVAAGIGYVAGLLTAPKSGKETRHDIKKSAVKTKNELEKKLKSLSEDASSLIASAEKRLRSLSSKAGSELKEAVKKATNAKSKAREVLSAVHEGEADDRDLDSAIKELNSAMTNLKKYMTKS